MPKPGVIPCWWFAILARGTMLSGSTVCALPQPSPTDGTKESLRFGPSVRTGESVRATINAKNELYFHRWRPQNVTYLFGFRKHEQGNNAVEIPQFDPLVAERKPKSHASSTDPASSIELTR